MPTIYDYVVPCVGTFIFFTCLKLILLTPACSNILSISKLSLNKRFLVANHITALIFTISFLSLTISYHNPLPWHYSSPDTKYTSELDRLNFAMLTGYFSYDTIAISLHMMFIKGAKLDFVTIIHHILGIVANIYSITQSIDGYFLLQGILTLESSNINYHIYRIIQHKGSIESDAKSKQKNNSDNANNNKCFEYLDLANKVCFFVVYTVLRMMCGLHLEWYLWYYEKSLYTVVLGGIAALISVIWYHEIVSWLWVNVISKGNKDNKDSKDNKKGK